MTSTAALKVDLKLVPEPVSSLAGLAKRLFACEGEDQLVVACLDAVASGLLVERVALLRPLAAGEGLTAARSRGWRDALRGVRLAFGEGSPLARLREREVTSWSLRRAPTGADAPLGRVGAAARVGEDGAVLLCVYSSRARRVERDEERLLLGMAGTLGAALEAHARRAAELTAARLGAARRVTTAAVKEWNDALMSINGFAALVQEAVQEALPPGHPAAQHLGRLLASGREAEALAARLSPGFPLRELRTGGCEVDQALRTLAEHHTPGTPTLALRLGAPGARLRTPPELLLPVVANLLDNARASAAQAGTITLETGRVDLDGPRLRAVAPSCAPGRYLRLTVRDTGRGFDPAALARAFEPYGQPGLRQAGFGLWRAYQLATSLGGGVSLSSPPWGETEVNLYFPLEAPQAPHGPRLRGPRPPGPGAHP